MSGRDTSRSEIPTESEPHPPTRQPVGLPVDVTPARRPGPVTLEGRYGRVEKLDVRHAANLWKAYAGYDHIWTYLSAYGPFSVKIPEGSLSHGPSLRAERRRRCLSAV